MKALTGYLFSGFQTYKWQLDRAVEQSLNSAWREVKSEVDNIPTSSSVPEISNGEEARKLNRLDSKYWLILRAIELLSVGVHSSNRNVIDWKLHELDEERDAIRNRLRPLRRRYYKGLDRIQNSWDICYSFLTLEIVRKGREFRKTEKILAVLDKTYTGQVPSRENIQEMLEVVDEKVANHPRSQSLHRTSRLLNWIYLNIESLTTKVSEDPKYKDYPVRARRGRPCYHLPNACSHYPRVEKPEDQATILFFRTVEEADAKNLDLCGSCKRILRRE